MKTARFLILIIIFELVISSCTANPITTIFSISPSPTTTETIPPTMTATIEPTATPNQYLVDKNKLSKTPSSYDYLINHLDEFVQGPDPWTVGADSFIQWDIDKLDPALGDPNARDINLQVNNAGVGSGELTFWCRPFSPITGQMEFFYFDHNGIIYPVYLITGISTSDKTLPEIGVILLPDLLPETSLYYGFQTVDLMAGGDYEVDQIITFYEPDDHLPQEVNDLIATGVSSVDLTNIYTYIGFGYILLEKKD